ncbi:hypothetical protein [Lysinibacillus capsici]|uniref:hypothetical protein n=1 Tax=Lysinibacillus capsici TaxID=2115968 RepID=UPI000E2096AC|nr:hypothetical protein [Lysinibacillus capsici]RDV35893.1 hypothetical protein C7B89_00020 [Lysinibacillus capsici]
MNQKPYYAYLTRLNFLKLKEISEEYNIYDINRMIWDGQIYFDNLNYIHTILKKNDYEIQKLSLPNFDHYFILQNKADETKPILFWVNVLDNLDIPNDLKYIFTYKTNPNEFQLITLNNIRYSLVHVGNMIVEYSKLKGFNKLNRNVMELFYKDFNAFVTGNLTTFKFSYSIIENTCIVYRVKEF